MNIVDWLQGKKLYIGGAGAILIGVGEVMYDWYNGSFQSPEHYLGWLVTGWTIIGGKSALKKIVK